MSWVAEELKTVNLGDKRRNRRLIKIVEDLSAMPHASVTQAARDGAAVQGIYEFWGNVRVEPSEILAAHRDSTLSRVEREEIVLAVQDTTELDFSSQPKTQGLGALNKKDAQEWLSLGAVATRNSRSFGESFSHLCDRGMAITRVDLRSA